jgi:hypothetical protein
MSSNAPPIRRHRNIGDKKVRRFAAADLKPVSHPMLGFALSTAGLK